MSSSDADMLVARLDRLADLSDEPGRITRLFLSPAMAIANRLVLSWMLEAGLEAHEDAAGNLIGRYEGDHPQARAIILGSHLDTVRDAGRFDGTLGVLAAIACVARLRERGRRLPFAIEVAGFADEEGTRFGSTVLGSRLFAGLTISTDLERTDSEGVSVTTALVDYGLDPASALSASHEGPVPLGYIELHMEQGPILEEAGLALGTVAAICGQDRFRLRFSGQSGHAGTVPMKSRHDALMAATECALVVEKHARLSGLVGTVGTFGVPNGSVNVIPGSADFSVDLRGPDDSVRQAALLSIFAEQGEVCARRGVTFSHERTGGAPATSCAPWLTKVIDKTLHRTLGEVPLSLVSGAGHDAVAVSHITDVGMIFVRCRGGVSHNPAEHVSLQDVAVAIEALYSVIEEIADGLSDGSLQIPSACGEGFT